MVAASNRNLGNQVEAGKFRENLYYKQDIVRVRVTALRERLKDLASISRDLGIQAPDIKEEDLRSLNKYDWPGNVRELKNIVERCLLLKKSPA